MTLRAPAKEDERMKAQKLGLFLGMNMAVACMVMQGCKAVKPGQGAQSPA